MKVKHLFSGVLAMLAALLLTGCFESDNPVSPSIDIDTSTMNLSVGQSITRKATTSSTTYGIVYLSNNPAVAMVDQNGKVTGVTAGTTVIMVGLVEKSGDEYTGKTSSYIVVVSNPSAEDLAKVDKATPLTLLALADGKITVNFNGGITLTGDIHYTINAGAEQTIPKNTTGAFDIAVKKNDVVQLYSLNSSLGGNSVAGARGGTRAVDDGAKYINIRPSMKTEIFGNVMSLLKGKDGFADADALEAKNTFYGLFAGAEKLVNDADRQLVLPATTLKESCYQDMFNGCKGIEKAPELPAPTLEKNCYQEMFYDCSKLNSVKCLATDISAENSTKDWLGKAGSEATSEKVIETQVPMDDVPADWTEVIASIDLSTLAADYEAQDGDVLTGTLDGNAQPYKITIADGATVTLDGVTINGVSSSDVKWAGITCLGDATIILKDGSKNTVKGFYEDYPGIQAGPTGKTLVIKGEDQGTGSLDASPYDGGTEHSYGAGIGGGLDISCGDINIQGGVITVTGGYGAAGIGVGEGYEEENVSCATITISGGNVTATGGYGAAGIGGGYAYQYGVTCGAITISGGTVTAAGGDNAAGIGSGESNSGNTNTCGDITITADVTSVTATKGKNATNSIGAGNSGTCGTITIGGKVYADGVTISPYTYPEPTVGGVTPLDPFAGGGDPLPQ